MSSLLLVAALTLFAAPRQANALLIQLTFSDTVLSTDFPGISLGDSFVITILADNGGTSLLSQTWGPGDFVSANVNIGNGTYTASFTPPAFAGFNAATNGTGALTGIFLYDFGGVSTLSTTPLIIVNQGRNIAFDGSFFADATNVTLPANFTVAAAAIPEPATLALLGLGLFGVAVARRRLR